MLVFSLLSYSRDLFFKCDSVKYKEVSFVHLLVVPKKIHSVARARFTNFWLKLRFQTLFFLSFWYFRDLFFKFFSQQIKEYTFARLLIVPRKKVTSYGSSTFEKIILPFFDPNQDIWGYPPKMSFFMIFACKLRKKLRQCYICLAIKLWRMK